MSPLCPSAALPAPLHRSRPAGRKPLVLAACCLPLLALSIAASEAAIIRSPGSSVGQDSFNETTYLLSNDYLAVSGILYTGGPLLDSYWRNSLMPPVHATPSGDCWFNTITIDPFPGLFRTECHYEFFAGDPLVLQGDIITALTGATFRLTWQITGNGRSWDFVGDSLDFTLAELLMPADMTPGDYAVRLLFEQWAPVGTSFFTFSNILDPKLCIDAGDPPVTYCGQIGSSGDYRSYQSSAALLRIHAVEVPAPGALGLIGLGLLLLAGWRGRSR